MKKTKLHSLLGVTFLALAGSFAAAGSAHAQVATSAANGDLFLGFRASGGFGASSTYLIDIGSSSLYRNATGNIVLNSASGINIGNVGADLSFLFGSNWATRSDILWGVVGFSDGSDGDGLNTEYASKGETTFGTQTAAWARRTNSNQQSTSSKINSLIGAYLTSTSTANSTKGVIEGATDSNSWASNMSGGALFTGGVSFGFYNTSLEGSFAGGPGGSALDLFRMATGSGAGSYLGNFTADSSGNITFHSAAAVPEPASLAMLGFGGALLGLVRRRRPVVA